MSPLQSICTKCGICVRVFSYVKDNHVENLYIEDSIEDFKVNQGITENLKL